MPQKTAEQNKHFPVLPFLLSPHQKKKEWERGVGSEEREKKKKKKKPSGGLLLRERRRERSRRNKTIWRCHDCCCWLSLPFELEIQDALSSGVESWELPPKLPDPVSDSTARVLQTPLLSLSPTLFPNPRKELCHSKPAQLSPSWADTMLHY